MKIRLKRAISIVAIALALCTGFALNGCNTIEGVGEDIEAGGDRIQDAADNE